MTQRIKKAFTYPATWMLTLALLLGAGVIVRSQTQSPGATPVQQQQPFFNCNNTATATGAGNATPTLTTITPPAGQYVYVCSLHIVEVANGAVTGAAGPAPIFTTTNLPNNLVYWGDNSSLTTGQQKIVVDDVFPLLVKAATPGVAVTVATSAGQSTQSVRLNVTYFTAP